MNSNNHRRRKGPHIPPSPLVEASFVFQDSLKHPIQGLVVRLKTGAGAPPAPRWQSGGQDSSAPAAASAPSTPTSTPGSGGSGQTVIASNSLDVTTDKDGYAVTISNVARNQPIEIFVKKKSGEFGLKGSVMPSKDMNAYAITSPEYHFDAVTQLSPKDEMELDIHMPVVKEGETMTIDRLLNEFGPYIGDAEKITEQGKIKKDFPVKKTSMHTDASTGKSVTDIVIEHHYKAINTGKPRTVTVSLLPSRLNYPAALMLTDDHFSYLAKSFGCETAAVKAVTMTETGGRGYDKNGLPRILLERHYFYRLSLPKAKQANWKHEKNPYSKFSDVCNPIYGGYGPAELHQYERLVKAARLDQDAALMSCSWGAFQVMGESFKDCGCTSVVEMVNSYLKSIDGHVQMFEQFMKNAKPVAIKALKEKNWVDFATAYNGGNWRTQNPDYANNMKSHYDEYK